MISLWKDIAEKDMENSKIYKSGHKASIIIGHICKLVKIRPAIRFAQLFLFFIFKMSV
jgi:hypothetical protein